jgi:uncharacterized protein YraI
LDFTFLFHGSIRSFAIFFELINLDPDGTILRVNSANGLNVRAEPCTNARIITTLGNGATTTSAGQVKDACGYKWINIRGNFGRGWAASNFLQVVPGNNLVYGPGKKF